MLIIGIGSHVTYAFCHFTLMIPTVDATVGRTVPYIVLNHAAQHLSFLLGCFLGQSLISGQRRFFDEAWKLRIKLLERRCQQLEEEKERADYDRQLVQHAVDQRMNKRASRDEDSMSGISGLSGSRASAAGAPPVPPEAPPNTIVLRSSAVPAGPHNDGMAMVANAGAAITAGRSRLTVRLCALLGRVMATLRSSSATMTPKASLTCSSTTPKASA